MRVALAVQNYLEDMANTLERLHDFISWADPRATTIFLSAILIVVLAIAAFSLPLVLSVGLCWTVSLLPHVSAYYLSSLSFIAQSTLEERDDVAPS